MGGDKLEGMIGELTQRIEALEAVIRAKKDGSVMIEGNNIQIRAANGLSVKSNKLQIEDKDGELTDRLQGLERAIHSKKDGSVVIEGNDVEIRSANRLRLKSDRLMFDNREVSGTSPLTNLLNEVKKMLRDQSYPVGQH